MKLWILQNRDHEHFEKLGIRDPWDPWYDKTFGMVVRAKTEEDARMIASEQVGYEHFETVYEKELWTNNKFTTCAELNNEGESGVILEDHRSA